VEEVLYMHPAVREAVVVGVPHPERGDDTVKAFLVPRTAGHLPSVEDIRAFCRLYLAPYKVPREIMFRSDLPRTVVGKVMRRMLVDEELAQQQ
jgi:long-chain acyl-CoA synthetase